VYKVPDDIRRKNVSDIGFKPDVIKWLIAHGCNTVEDVIKHQDTMPNNILVSVRAKIMFGIDM